MRKCVHHIYALLTIKGRRGVFLLLLGMILTGLLEVAGVVSVMPFIAVASQPELIETQPLLRELYTLSGMESANDFLVALGVVMLVFIILSNASMALVNYALLRFTYMQGHALSMRLLKGYGCQPYSYYLTHNSSLLGAHILTQVANGMNGVVLPFLRLVSRAVVLLFLAAMLVWVQPLVTLSLFVGLGAVYLLIYWLLQGKLLRAGRAFTTADSVRFKSINEVFGGIKEIKLRHKEAYFIARFAAPSAQAAQGRALSDAAALLPRYALEIIAFALLILVIVLQIFAGHSLQSVMPLLSLYALAGYRMLPSAQQIFSSFSKLRFHAATLELLYHDVQEAQHMLARSAEIVRTGTPLLLQHGIALRDVTYCYPNQDAPVLDALTLNIPAQRVTALVGETGAGKSTVADILMGVLTAQHGALQVDDTPITPENLRDWQASIGYVPQHIFLLDDTVRRNIAFGVEDDAIDEDAMRRAAQLAQIDAFIEKELPQGYDTAVGERGIRLSGGQRQRLGLARALYHNPPVLVLDEATSALDNVTEKAVVDAIHALGGEKTLLVIAHRMSTVRQCGHVVFLQAGQVTAEGDFDTLYRDCAPFRRLVDAAGEVGDATL